MKWVKVFRSVCLFSIFPCVCSKFPLEYLIYFEECRFTLLAISVHLLSFWGTTETIYWGLLFNFTLLLDLFPPYCCLGHVKFLWKLIAGSEKNHLMFWAWEIFQIFIWTILTTILKPGFQHKNRFWKICTESWDIGKNVFKFNFPSKMLKISYLFANISGHDA